MYLLFKTNENENVGVINRQFIQVVKKIINLLA